MRLSIFFARPLRKRWQMVCYRLFASHEQLLSPHIMKTLATLLCAVFALTGCGSGSHLKVKLGTNQFWPNIPELKLSAIDQDVTVQAVEVNGGDCVLNMLERFPRTIPKGMTDHVDIKSDCDEVSRVTITTGDGSFKFTF